MHTFCLGLGSDDLRRLDDLHCICRWMGGVLFLFGYMIPNDVYIEPSSFRAFRMIQHSYENAAIEVLVIDYIYDAART